MKIKVVTMCGSMKFNRQMREISRKLETKNGWAVIQCVYSKKSDKFDNVDEMKNIELVDTLEKPHAEQLTMQKNMAKRFIITNRVLCVA